MESWSYDNGGKGFVSNDITSHTKNSWMSYGNNSLLVSGHSWIENRGFGDLTTQESMGKQTINDSIRNPRAICSKIGDGRLMNPIMVTGSAFCGDDRLSSSAVESNNSRDSSLIALKLGRLADQRDANNSKDYRNTPPKRLRMGGLNSHVAYCQVHGCNKDLSASKEYHRRHKVCEIHSKTAKVIVNGIEKRFCQQCSRFHLLAEFDDGKRSCRKRLAGHNERRRKPQVGGHSRRTGRFLQSCNGFPGTSLTATSFICQDIFPDKYGTTDWYRSIKVEQGSDSSHLPAAPIITNSPYYSKSLFLLDDLKRPAYFTPENSLSSIPEPGCALSLLSSQSHNSSSGIPIMMPGSIRSYNVGQISDKLVGLGSQASNSNKFSSSGISSVDGSQVGPMLISDDSDPVNFDTTDGIYHRSDYMSAKHRLSCENGTTVDLLQLSSQLQRVEHQRQSVQLKPINNR